MDWFERLTGFRELSWHDTRQRLRLEGPHLVSAADARRLPVGDFELVPLATLRHRARIAPTFGIGRLRLTQIRGEALALHTQTANAGALFQVASQFNMLEMISPRVTPEDGLTLYQADPTQGPACAMAAGAATLYRLHFVDVEGQRGQTRDRQLDGLRDIGDALALATGLPRSALWTMRNGYALCHEQGLCEINTLLGGAPAHALEQLRGLLKVGVHRQAAVTWGADLGPAQPASPRGMTMPASAATPTEPATARAAVRPSRPDAAAAAPAVPHTVSQVFCAALPVAYGEPPAALWAPLATLVLEAAYEATLWEAVVHAAHGGSGVVYLTLLGGGAFGNDEAWILQAMRHALTLARDCPLDVRLVSRDGRVYAGVGALLAEFGHTGAPPRGALA